MFEGACIESVFLASDVRKGNTVKHYVFLFNINHFIYLQNHISE